MYPCGRDSTDILHRSGSAGRGRPRARDRATGAGGGPTASHRAARTRHRDRTAGGGGRATRGVWVLLLPWLLSTLETPSPSRGVGARQRMVGDESIDAEMPCRGARLSGLP